MKEIIPTKLSGTLSVPGSKYIANRVLPIAALALGTTVVNHIPQNNDIDNCIESIKKIGATVVINDDELIITGTGGHIKPCCVDVGESGTLFRIMTGLLSFSYGSKLIGTPFLMNRPIVPLIQSLNDLGFKVEKGKKIEFNGGELVKNTTSIVGDISSQFISSLILVGVLSKKTLEIEITTKIVSKEYIDMTIEVLNHFGIRVDFTENKITVPKNQIIIAKDFVIPQDSSSADFFLAGAALSGGTVIVKGMKENRFANVLEKLGCTISVGHSITLKSNGDLEPGLAIDMSSIPDSVPALAVVLATIKGKTTITNISHLKHKESNRIVDLANELRKTGIKVDVNDDSMVVHGGELHGAILDTHNDHRLAMALSLLGLKVKRIQIKDERCVNKSFPTFWKMLNDLGVEYA